MNVVEKIEHFKRYDGLTYPELRQVYKMAVKLLGQLVDNEIATMRETNRLKLGENGHVMIPSKKAKELQSRLMEIGDYREGLQIERDLDQLERYMDKFGVRVWKSNYENIRGSE